MVSKQWGQSLRAITVLLLTGLTLAMVGCQLPVRYARQQGLNAYADKNYDEARKQFNRAVAAQPEDWKSLYYLGMLDLRAGQSLDAQLKLEKSLSLRPDSEETPKILDALALSLFNQKKYDNLTALLQQSVDRYNKSQDYLRQGDFMVKMGDVDGAKLAYTKAVHFATPTDTTALVALAQFYDSLGLNAEALLAWRQAYYVNPDDIQVSDAIRAHGMVPGPTIALEPQR